jgi:hypothetical protein
MYIRYGVVIGMGGLGLLSFINGAPIEDNWLAAKILLFAGAVALGVYLRSEIKNLTLGFGMIRAGGDEADKGNDIVSAALDRSKVAALFLWFIVAVIAFIGKVKPF